MLYMFFCFVFGSLFFSYYVIPTSRRSGRYAVVVQGRFHLFREPWCGVRGDPGVLDRVVLGNVLRRFVASCLVSPLKCWAAGVDHNLRCSNLRQEHWLVSKVAVFTSFYVSVSVCFDEGLRVESRQERQRLEPVTLLGPPPTCCAVPTRGSKSKAFGEVQR